MENQYGPSRLHALRLQGCLSLRAPSSHQPIVHRRSAPDYVPIRVVGKGAFGVVFVAEGSDGEPVAVKKVLQDPRYKNRELDILRLLHHRNCVSLRHAFKSRGQSPHDVYLNIVMDYLPTTLHAFATRYRDDRMYPPVLFVKLFMFQVFAALNYLHGLGVAHRDLKPPNIIIDPDTGDLKICDFGSAKVLKAGERSVSYIASRFYRAPELVLDCCEYTTAIDVWAAGCVFAEALMGGTPLFPGPNPLAQINEIARILGPPTDNDLQSFQHTVQIDLQGIESRQLEDVLPPHTPAGVVSFLKTIFVYNPENRPTAIECMQDHCFDDLFAQGIALPNGRPLPPLIRNP
jgi:glycogen synthase kinase 3 beta